MIGRCPIIWDIAQLVVQSAVNRQVVGSNPAIPVFMHIGPM